MSRDALIVGINHYQHLPSLTAPASDAEAIAQRLGQDGDFHRIERLPETITATGSNPSAPRKPVISPKAPVSQKKLERALERLFLPGSEQAPQTALFYFSGHGIPDKRGYDKGYLAASDTTPKDPRSGLSLRWLQWLLSESVIKQQIVWLDCCHSGSLIVNVGAANPGNSESRDRCFIASSRDFEKSWEDINSSYSVLTKALLEGLDPTRLPGQWIDTFSLVDHVNKALRGELQVPVCTHFGESIDLTRTWQAEAKKVKDTIASSSVCPYKGLEYFNYDGEDPKYFFGRESLTDTLVDRIRTSQFMAVVGASGSGKSSVLRAGLLHQLSIGRKIAGSEQWQILIMQPDATPMQNLARAFVDPTFNQLKRAAAQRQAEALLEDGASGLIRLVRASPSPRVVLLIDQLEEIFTRCHDHVIQETFFKCILGALEQDANDHEDSGPESQSFRVVISMRGDFLGKCLERNYSGLSQQVKENFVPVTPMTEQELRSAICKPAQQVGLSVASALVTEILHDIKDEPGRLPLLQYTLKEVWEKRQGKELTLEAYFDLGRIEGALEKKATELYEAFPAEQQTVVKHIFLALTQLGEGTADTRRRVFKQELIDAQSDRASVDKAITKLADEKLIVTTAVRGKGATSEAQRATVEVAHEALIRYWSKLRAWLNENRDSLRRQRYIEKEAREWVANKKNRDYLLRGSRLAEAQSFFSTQTHQLSVPDVAQEFFQKSVRRQATYRYLKRGLITGMSIALVGLCGWSWSQRKNSGILKASESARVLLNSNKEFDSLLEILQSVSHTNTLGVADYTRARTGAVLRQIIYSVREKNRLEGHLGKTTSVNYSPDGNSLVSTDGEGLIKIWQSNGKIQKTFQAHSRIVWDVDFNPAGTHFASASADGTLKIWQVDGLLQQTIEGHGHQVLSVKYSKDGKMLISADKAGVIKLWNAADGKPLKTIQTNQGWVYDVAVSGDNRFFASSGENGTVKLWTREGSLVRMIAQDDVQPQTAQTDEKSRSKQGDVLTWSVAFSPDSDLLAVGSQITNEAGQDLGGVLKVWTLDGTLHRTYRGHRKRVTGLSFSPDGQMLASVSYDKTVKLWDLTTNDKVSDDSITLVGHREGLWDVDFHRDGRSLATAARDRTVRIWQRDWHAPTTFETNPEEGKLISMDVSPDGEKIASTSELASSNGDSPIKQWNITLRDKTGSVTSLLEGHTSLVSEVKFSPASQHLASASNDNTLKLWRLDGSLEASFSGHTEPVRDVSFSPDGTLLASGSTDQTVKLWNLQGELIKTLKGHTHTVLDVEFGPNGKLLASASADNTIKLWGLDGSLKQTLSGHEDSVYHVSFSPDGKLLASGSADSTVRVWTRNGKLLQVLQGPKDFIFDVYFSPDGEVIAAGSADGEINFWHRNGLLIDTIKREPESFLDIAYSPTDDTFLMAGQRGISRWDLNTDKLFEDSCNWIGDYLSSSLTVTPEMRELCPKVEISPAVVLEQGKDLARKGESDKATEKFKDAIALNPNFKFSPAEEVKRLSAINPLILEALALARIGYNPEAATESFQAALSVEPALGTVMTPDLESKRLTALSLMEELIYQLEVDDDDIPEMLKNFNRARSLYPKMGISANVWHGLCRNGAHKGYAADVLEACDSAIISDPKDGRFYDSRAIAKILSGAEVSEITSDFQRFIDWAESKPVGYLFTEQSLQDWREKRKQCIANLTADNGQKVAGKQKSDPVKLSKACDYFEFFKE